MRLLLDEMISATVAGQLRARGHDVVAVQDLELRHLRGVDDCLLLDHAAEEHRALVTDHAGAVTGRAKAAVHNGLSQLAEAGVLVPVAGGQRNCSCEAAGLLPLIADLEDGEMPR